MPGSRLPGILAGSLTAHVIDRYNALNMPTESLRRQVKGIERAAYLRRQAIQRHAILAGQCLAQCPRQQHSPASDPGCQEVLVGRRQHLLIRIAAGVPDQNQVRPLPWRRSSSTCPHRHAERTP